jgi:predicted O-methyltransferase YrrM
MYLPPPLRQFREFIRERGQEQEAVRGFRSIISNDSVNDPIDAALRQTLGRPSKANSTVFRTIENRRSELRRCTDSFEFEEWGAGYHDNVLPKDQQNTGIVETITVSEAASWSQDRIHCRLLHYLIRTQKPAKALELGSCVGISGSYIASALAANGQGHLWTIEGSPGIAKLTKQTFERLSLQQWATLVVGPFSRTLQPTLKNGPFGFAFIDGHHDGDATIDYFNQIKPALTKNAVVMFDDIDWYTDMARAWSEIQRDPGFKTRTVGSIGVALARKGAANPDMLDGPLFL